MRDGAGDRGDLIVRLVVRLPREDDERLDAIADQLAELYVGEDVRADLDTGEDR